MWTVVLRPDPDANPNVAPVASFTTSCPTATCTVDASGSTDTAPGTVASYAWNFGDGTTGTGVSTTHTYTTSGSKTITLTVTDNQGLTNTTTRTVNVTVGGGGGVGNQPVPGHTRLVPDQPRNNTPRISTGEIWDIEVVGTGNAARVFIAGNFTSAANTVNPTTTVNQAYLLAYNLNTGLIDTTFRPTFGGGGVNAVEASPDGTKLFVGGSFNTVNGVAKQKVASLNLTTGAPLTTFGFTNSTNNQVQSLAVTNSTVYVGGRYTRINGVLKTGLAAVNAASGAVDASLRQQPRRRHRRQRPARRPAAQAHPRQQLAARRAHRPADRRPGPARHGHHRHRHQGAAALPQHPVGPEPRSRRRRHPDLLRRHRARRLLLRRDQRLGR